MYDEVRGGVGALEQDEHGFGLQPGHFRLKAGYFRRGYHSVDELLLVSVIVCHDASVGAEIWVLMEVGVVQSMTVRGN